jgi:predicted mannosyl-3-phosphoglycerate phosphatase (HAD superfamily)
MFSFATTGAAAAIRLLGALFTAAGRANILTVGLGCDERDSAMLSAVDIPIVVRSRQHDQQGLLQFVPGAYVTRAPGAAGWLEAMLGTPFCDA